MREVWKRRDGCLNIAFVDKLEQNAESLFRSILCRKSGYDRSSQCLANEPSMHAPGTFGQSCQEGVLTGRGIVPSRQCGKQSESLLPVWPQGMVRVQGRAGDCGENFVAFAACGS